jgi:Na+-driven multidrug efflux pump
MNEEFIFGVKEWIATAAFGFLFMCIAGFIIYRGGKLYFEMFGKDGVQIPESIAVIFVFLALIVVFLSTVLQIKVEQNVWDLVKVVIASAIGGAVGMGFAKKINNNKNKPPPTSQGGKILDEE